MLVGQAPSKRHWKRSVGQISSDSASGVHVPSQKSASSYQLHIKLPMTAIATACCQIVWVGEVFLRDKGGYNWV